ncbi:MULTISPECIES: Tim44 domain-containing protein [unclassified Beijerinckia]|uniref:TIM44-like domain-containing protein n=1 Tax=unclassified Beijerinckia TaxID=2638183 RepID=UPI00089D469F|nr:MULTISPECIES: Tim44 domain-containing protein [unclassified Beijerinckia]MDH7799423.1 putative lipid-binding transport protein (Tim44 family) [Beijerinckia sp. GAS462]SED49902.1 Predicted lipid-binding transport protein, Tim44 family [Beijerinckia sp. 28-YEA-48]
MSSIKIGRSGRLLAVATVLALAFAPMFAHARAGSGGSMGSRGSFTNSAPRATPTAPNAGQPMQRTQSPQTQPQQTFNRPATPAAGGGMFSSPLARGIMGGLIGAGIFGLLSGSGLFSGLGSLAGMFGFLLQIALIAGIAMLALNWWRRRQQPAMATGAPRTAGLQGGAQQPNDYARTGNEQPANTAASGFGSMVGGGANANTQPETRPLKVEGEDYPAFERLLADVQTAYAAEDTVTLRRIVTPELAGYFEDDLEAMKKRGQATKADNVKLLQGDLSEAWSEPDYEYATVAMRFSLIDAVVDRVTGKLLEGDLTKPNEVTEIWTFVRPTGGKPQDWKLSAIQQVA